MNITLAKIQVHADMSAETNCFRASICLNGQVVGTVKNAGQGGCHEYDWLDREVGKRITAWSQTQKTEFDFEKLDQIIDRLLADHETRAQLRRWCKTQTVFRLKRDKAGEWRTIKTRFDKNVKEQLTKTYGDKLERIANEEN